MRLVQASDGPAGLRHAGVNSGDRGLQATAVSADRFQSSSGPECLCISLLALGHVSRQLEGEDLGIPHALGSISNSGRGSDLSLTTCGCLGGRHKQVQQASRSKGVVHHCIIQCTDDRCASAQIGVEQAIAGVLVQA